MANRLLAVGGLLGMLAVSMGAFGAHALRDRLSEAALEQWKTGAHYHLVHAVAILGAAALADRGFRRAQWAGWMFVIGTFIFAGSLYTLALSGIRIFGAITPIGGVFMIMGWGLLAYSAMQTERP